MKPQIKQRTLAMVTGFEQYTKETRQAEFLAEMEGADAAHLLLQQCFNLSDPAVEKAPYDSAVMRQFVGIDLEMHQANEGTQWYFRMKAHVGGGQ